MKQYAAFSAVLVLMSGCVSSETYRKQQAATDACNAEKAHCLSDKQSLQGKVDSLNQEKTALATTAQEKDAEIAKLKGTYDDLVGNLKNEIAAGEIQVTSLKGKLTLNMVEQILFNSGQAHIKPTGMQVLDRIGAVLKNVTDKDIRVEGFTDNVPVGPKLRAVFPTNWELSTARATNVVRYLQEHAGVDPARLVAAGYSEYHPVAPNDTPQGHAQNRRINIVLVAPEVSAPATSAPTTVAPNSAAPAAAPPSAPATSAPQTPAAPSPATAPTPPANPTP